MTGFLIVAALLTAAGLGFVLWPLLRPAGARRTTSRTANLSIYRDQFTELERDLALGTLDAAQYEAARGELERRMLDEVATQPVGQEASRRTGRNLALVIAFAMPLCAGLLYWRLGQPQAIGGGRAAAEAAITQEDFEAMTRALAERMAANPDDPVGWLMLGRAYKALERYPDAVKALQEADRRRPDEPEILVEYAEALGLARERTLQGEPQRLLDRALKIDPNHPKALTLAGTAAFEAKQYARAIDYWERLEKQVPADSDLARALQSGLAEARELAGSKGSALAGAPETIRGEVRLAAGLRARAGPEDTLFIVARAAAGPRMPLAVLRGQVRQLPLRFALDDSLAMTPQMKLSGFSNVIVTARISKSGNATAQSGDLEGVSGPVRPGVDGLVITIDTVVP